MWTRVHRIGAASLIVGVSMAWAILDHGGAVERITVSILPIPSPLLAAALAGFGASIGLVGPHVPVAERLRLAVARAAWALALVMGLACVVAASGLVGASLRPQNVVMLTDPVNVVAMIRNAGLFFALATASALAWGPALSWTVPLAYLVASLQLGGSEQTPAWWAMVRENDHVTWQLYVVGFAVALAGAWYVARRRGLTTA